jgi:hypothetical protein
MAREQGEVRLGRTGSECGRYDNVPTDLYGVPDTQDNFPSGPTRS